MPPGNSVFIRVRFSAQVMGVMAPKILQAPAYANCGSIPQNDLSCDRVSGGSSASIGAVFRTKGVIPVAVILCPSHSHSRCANWNFLTILTPFCLCLAL